MTPEVALFLGKARRLLNEAGLMARIGLHEAAGRHAYLAGFSAAQALIYERDGLVHKTHKGVRIEFARLTRDDPDIVRPLRAFLARTYELKAVADYEASPGAGVPPERAQEAVESAKLFVNYIERALGGSAGTTDKSAT